MLIVTEQELRQHIRLNPEVLEAVEDGFTLLAHKEAVMPPIMRVDLHDRNGEVDVKTAYVKGKELFAIKVSSGFFDNHRLGLPSASGLMLLLSTETGVPQAILLDNGYLTEVRTAAAGAIAASYLAPKTVSTLGIIGTGSQARFQARAAKLVRDFSRLLVYGRSPERAKQYAEEMHAELGVEVKVAETAEEVVRESQLVVTTTPATEPLIRQDWLHPGLHITAMGSDAEHKQELEAAVLAKADLLVCDSRLQCERLGELHHALAQGVLAADARIIELGELTAGERAGRDSEEQVTVCDLTGTGVQDTAIALYAFEKIRQCQLTEQTSH